MSEYLVNDTDLTSVANAIRTKGGTSNPLAFPSGFVSAVNAIPSGGGGGLEISLPQTNHLRVYYKWEADFTGGDISCYCWAGTALPTSTTPPSGVKTFIIPALPEETVAGYVDVELPTLGGSDHLWIGVQNSSDDDSVNPSVIFFGNDSTISLTKIEDINGIARWSGLGEKTSSYISLHFQTTSGTRWDYNKVITDYNVPYNPNTYAYACFVKGASED